MSSLARQSAPKSLSYTQRSVYVPTMPRTLHPLVRATPFGSRPALQRLHESPNCPYEVGLSESETFSYYLIEFTIFPRVPPESHLGLKGL
jgi:hypothetical protein